MTVIRNWVTGEKFNVLRRFCFVSDGREHSVVAGYLDSFRKVLANYLCLDNDTAFLITRPHTREVLLDTTAIGLFSNFSITYETLEVIALPIPLYDEEISQRMNNKLRFGEPEVFRFGANPSADDIGNRWYGQGIYEFVED